ncbi:MAG: hypothetical protein ACI9YO_003025 [Gammaproteobacteria bacterium]|jgi:hypothetical protein
MGGYNRLRAVLGVFPTRASDSICRLELPFVSVDQNEEIKMTLANNRYLSMPNVQAP